MSFCLCSRQVRRLLLEAFLRRLDNNDDWTDDGEISLENVEKGYFYGVFRNEKAKNYLNNRDKFGSDDEDASSYSGDNDSDSTISGDESDYSVADSDSDMEDPKQHGQNKRKIDAEEELRAIDFRGYLKRVPPDTSGSRYANPYVHASVCPPTQCRHPTFFPPTSKG